mgnify:CR=1 FL=1
MAKFLTGIKALDDIWDIDLRVPVKRSNEWSTAFKGPAYVIAMDEHGIKLDRLKAEIFTINSSGVWSQVATVLKGKDFGEFSIKRK